MEITKQQQRIIDTAKKMAQCVNSIEDGLQRKEISSRLKGLYCPYYFSVAYSDVFKCYKTLGRSKFYEIEQRPVHFSKFVEVARIAYETRNVKKRDSHKIKPSSTTPETRNETHITNTAEEHVVMKKQKTKKCTQRDDDYWTIKIKKPFRKLIKIIRFIKTL